MIIIIDYSALVPVTRRELHSVESVYDLTAGMFNMSFMNRVMADNVFILVIAYRQRDMQILLQRRLLQA